MWSSTVKKDPPSKPPTTFDGAPAPILGMVGNCNSRKGISIAVFDANAIIEGRQNLTNLAQKLVTVPGVLSEIRDATSCSRLDLMPFPIETREPSDESVTKVRKFARATGDRQALSVVDVELIALAYELEVQFHGTKNLRDIPPPIQTVREKKLPDKELPGWGSNEQEVERKQRRYPPKKTEVKLEGKMVVEGIDASQGEHDDGEWRPAVSSSTHRKFLRRKAKWERYNALAQQDIQRDLEAGNLTQQDTIHQMSDENCAKVVGENDEELEEDSSIGEDDSEVEAEGIDEASSMADDASSEQSWPLRALSESSVACITADYAMQNVILQMGLRLLAPGGMQIRQLNRWIMRCHACYTMVTDPNPCKFIDCCPKCGNLGTLRQVAVTIGENGTTIAAHKQRFSLRGTKFSIPMPKSGRDAITKNLVLREDQLPQNYLHPKTKKKASKLGDEYFISDDVFMNPYSDRKAPLQPPMRKTMAIFSQKRNPNDNHYSRSMH